MSFYTMAVFGTVPIGSLIAGAMADKLGAPRTFVFGGALSVLGGVSFLRVLPRLRAFIRPVYQRLGILPTPSASPEPE
jgi:hypothetical protein